MLFIGALLLGLFCIQGSHELTVSASRARCPPEYPRVWLKEHCSPVPEWCERLSHRMGAGEWYKCKRYCRTYLWFGRRHYAIKLLTPVGTKLQLFRLELPSWHKYTLTLWSGKVYCRKGSKAWKIVYLVNGQLLAVNVRAKPPYDCSTHKHSSGGGHSTRLGHVGKCHGKKCSVRLPVRQFTQVIKSLCHSGRNGHSGSCESAELEFVLVTWNGHARLVSVHLRQARSHREAKQEENPSARYQKFFRNQRKDYWLKKGWRIRKMGVPKPKVPKPNRSKRLNKQAHSSYGNKQAHHKAKPRNSIHHSDRYKTEFEKSLDDF